MDPTDMKLEDEAQKQIKELFRLIRPEFEVEFANDFSSNLEDEDWNQIILLINRRKSKLFGWFWKWYYRPRRM